MASLATETILHFSITFQALAVHPTAASHHHSTVPLHLAGQLHPALALTTLCEVPARATVLITDEHDARYSLLHQHSKAPHIQPNVYYDHYSCRCGCIHIAVKTTRALPKGEMLLYNDNQTPAMRTLLVQFGGSYKPRARQGGAGIAAFLVENNRMQLLEWQAIAIAHCPDNIYAETIGCRQATQLAAQWYAKLAPDGPLKATSSRLSNTSATTHGCDTQASRSTFLTEYSLQVMLPSYLGRDQACAVETTRSL